MKTITSALARLLIAAAFLVTNISSALGQTPGAALSYPIDGTLKVQILPFTTVKPDGTLFEYAGGTTTLTASTNGVLSILYADSTVGLVNTSYVTNQNRFYLDKFTTDATRVVKVDRLYRNQLSPARVLTASAALNFASMATLTSATDLTITVTGATTNDTVVLGLPAAPTAGIVFSAFVSAADTVTVRAFNVSSGTVDPASATYKVKVIQ
jgi:hypothetical protein